MWPAMSRAVKSSTKPSQHREESIGDTAGQKPALGVALAVALFMAQNSALAGSFEIPAWAFDRGNVRTLHRGMG